MTQKPPFKCSFSGNTCARDNFVVNDNPMNALRMTRHRAQMARMNHLGQMCSQKPICKCCECCRQMHEMQLDKEGDDMPPENEILLDMEEPPIINIIRSRNATASGTTLTKQKPKTPPAVKGRQKPAKPKNSKRKPNTSEAELELFMNMLEVKDHPLRQIGSNSSRNSESKQSKNKQNYQQYQDMIGRKRMEVINEEQEGEEEDEEQGYFDKEQSRKIQDSCADFLNIVHDTVLETVQKSVETTMREYFMHTMEKMECMCSQMMRNECLLSKMYMDIVDKISCQNEKNHKQFNLLCQCLTDSRRDEEDCCSCCECCNQTLNEDAHEKTPPDSKHPPNVQHEKTGAHTQTRTSKHTLESGHAVPGTPPTNVDTVGNVQSDYRTHGGHNPHEPYPFTGPTIVGQASYNSHIGNGNVASGHSHRGNANSQNNNSARNNHLSQHSTHTGLNQVRKTAGKDSDTEAKLQCLTDCSMTSGTTISRLQKVRDRETSSTSVNDEIFRHTSRLAHEFDEYMHHTQRVMEEARRAAQRTSALTNSPDLHRSLEMARPIDLFMKPDIPKRVTKYLCGKSEESADSAPLRH